MKESNLSHIRPIYYYAAVLQTVIGNIDQMAVPMGVEPTSCSLKTNCSKPIKLQHHFTKINQLPILYTNFLFSSNEIYGAPCRNRTGVACLEGRNMAILSRVPNQLALSEGLEPPCIQLAFSCLEDRRHTTAFIQRTLLIYSSNFSKSTLFSKSIVFITNSWINFISRFNFCQIIRDFT
jgi:hypothetical protein